MVKSTYTMGEGREVPASVHEDQTFKGSITALPHVTFGDQFAKGRS